jgi:hypothetical protein
MALEVWDGHSRLGIQGQHYSAQDQLATTRVYPLHVALERNFVLSMGAIELLFRYQKVASTTFTNNTGETP